jgi:hypothetical protein
MLDKFKVILSQALDHKENAAKLRSRAENIKGTTGDFKIDAFVARLSVFEDDLDSLEGLLSTTISKNPKDWVDRDQESAINELGRICGVFRQVEALGSLRARKLQENLLPSFIATLKIRLFQNHLISQKTGSQKSPYYQMN